MTNRLASLMATTIVSMSKSVDRKLGSTMGGSKGSTLLSLTSPPAKTGVRGQMIQSVKRMEHLREVGEIRLVANDVQLPSGLEYPGMNQPCPKMNW